MKTLCTKINSNGMVVVSAPLVMSLVFWVKQSLYIGMSHSLR